MILCVNTHQPWNSALPTLMLLPKCRTLNDASQIHARMVTTGFIRNTSFTTKVIRRLLSSPHRELVEFARFLFFKHHGFRNSQEQEDTFLWNAVIKSYSHGCDPRGALIVLCLMLETGISADRFTFSLVLKACSRLCLIKEGLQIHGLLSKMGIGSDVFLQNCLISCYLRRGAIQFARRLFDRMLKRDSVSYNSMIDGYVKYGMVAMACELFECMPPEHKNLISWNSIIRGHVQFEEGLAGARDLFEKMPNRDLISWNIMLDGYAKHGKMADAEDLFNAMPEVDLVSWVTMMDGYAKLGKVNIARALFDRMPQRDVISCNTMMTGYVQNGLGIEALKIFYDMRRKSEILHDDTTLLIVLSAVTQSGHIEIGTRIHRYLEFNNYSLDNKFGTALIDMYSKCGNVEDALAVFKKLKERSVDHWNAIIGGLAIHGLGGIAFEFLLEMERLSITPDEITFIAVLNACGHSGFVKEGLICFEIMRRVHSLEPKMQHYGCMVDILSRAGHVEVAKKFIADMPIEPNDVIWRTLLSACRVYANSNIGEPAAEELIRVNSMSPSSYVLLSNIYASLGMWDRVRCVRTLMKEKNLKKIPGCSWIEIEGSVHEFSVQDNSHPQVTEIYSMLNSL